MIIYRAALISIMSALYAVLLVIIALAFEVSILVVNEVESHKYDVSFYQLYTTVIQLCSLCIFSLFIYTCTLLGWFIWLIVTHFYFDLAVGGCLFLSTHHHLLHRVVQKLNYLWKKLTYHMQPKMQAVYILDSELLVRKNF